jgi:hypothetical protein
LNGKEIMKNDDLLEIIKTDDIIEVSNIKDEKYIIKDEEKEKDSEDIGKKKSKNEGNNLLIDLKEDQTKNIHAILSENLEENKLKIEKLYLKKSKKNLII